MSRPHFELVSQTNVSNHEAGWRFTLKTPDGKTAREECDLEPGDPVDRVELLSVIRGLEALEQPSDVTLVTSSHYVRCGIRYGLEDWRRSNWQWDRFGELVTVKNKDLWQRIDNALQVHRVQMKWLRIDGPHQGATPNSQSVATIQIPRPRPFMSGIRRLARLATSPMTVLSRLKSRRA